LEPLSLFSIPDLKFPDLQEKNCLENFFNSEQSFFSVAFIDVINNIINIIE
jgi:hypothetical protein